MCRHLAWLGAPRTLASLVLDGEHALLVQSYRPRRQRHGTINADGWGVGFYADGRGEPARWRSDRPLWSDTSFASLAPVISSACVLAAVRSATVGMPIDETSTAPFTDGRWLLSHNGVVDCAVLGPQLRAESVCDSAVLAAYVFESGADHLGKIVREVGARDPGARLNLLATDGARLLATAWGDTLSVLRTDDGVLVASEPTDDDPRWTDVPDRSLVEVTGGRITISSLED
ncbi:MAG TPA: ergothioneine biosynthesis protein EgtC [Jatrophihabitantaceae bacterium]|nr:ergothioneine biosynthesis protein EgtC [Jatrophihabitantaceae bacterium]